MLCQGETGVLPGSEIHFKQTGSQMYRLFYSVNCCGHYYCEYGYRIRRKHMDCLLLLSVEKGQLRLHYQGQRYLAQPGDIVLLDGTHPQYYDTPDYAEFYWLHIAGVNSFDLCEYLTSLHGSVLHRTANNKNAAALVRQVVFQFSTNQVIHNAEQSQMLHQIICGLIADGQPAGGTLAELDDPVQRAVKYIQENLGADLSLRKIAETVHLSPSHLNRLFREGLGHSVHEYIVLMRMDRAKYLLKITDMPIKQIAAQVGYRSESSFTGAFTEKIGISPRKFRASPLG